MLPQAGRPRERFVMSRERSANHNGINKGVGIVKCAFRVLSMTVVVGLLAAAFGVAGVFAQAVEVDENEVEWQAGDFVSPNAGDGMVEFLINDDDIQGINNGTAEWAKLPAAVEVGSLLDLIDGSVTTQGVTVPYSATTTPYALDATGFGADTPISEATVGAAGIATATGRPGEVATLVAAAAGNEYEIRFKYEIVDVFTGDDRRARVTSSSDPQGELVVIMETGATTGMFGGQLQITGNADAQGAADDGVYVEDGDTLTVTYLDSDGTAIDEDSVTVDSAAPTVSSISPADDTRTSSIRPSISFSVVDEGSGIGITNLTSNINLTINNHPATLSGSFLAAIGGYDVRFSQTTAWTEAAPAGFSVTDGIPFEFQITVEDDAGNSDTVDAREMVIDITAPSVTDVSTGGAATNIRIEFSEDLDGSSISAADFEVDGANPEDADLWEDEDADPVTTKHVDLTVAALDSDATPEVKVVGDGVKDVAGNALDEDTSTAADGIAPSLTSVVVDTTLAKEDDEVTATLSTNEKLRAGGVVVSINGPAADTSDVSGMADANATQPLEYAASAEVGTTTKTGRYGVSVQITDRAGNSSDNLTAVSDEEVTVDADDMVTVAKTPIGDRNFDGTVDMMDVDVPDGMTAGDVDASAGTIEVNGAAEGDEIEVSYKYVADATFEVDHDAPMIDFTPDGEKDIENTAPYIRVEFDEDEYPGDSHTETWLTAAALTDPDGEETNILDQFQSGDNKNYLWAASGLALGSHSLEVTGKDDNGNEATATLEFEIVARSKVTVDLVPGLNLISLPGVPADTAIDAVITNPDIEFVSTYDPRSPEGFQSAVRGPGGSFGSGQTLSIIDGSKAYWVSTTSYAPLEVDVPGYGGDAAAPPPVFRLAAGWNLVPVVAVNPATTAVDADVYLSGLSWSRGYGYDTEALPPALEGFTPDSDEMLTVGTGYWVYLTEAGDLVP